MADEEKKRKTPLSAENSPSVPLAGEEEMVPPPPPSSGLTTEKQKEKNVSLPPSQNEIEGASVSSPLPPSSPVSDSSEKAEGKNGSPPPPPPGKRETIAATVGLPPKKKFSFDKRIFLIILLIFLALVGIVAGVYLVKQSQNPKKSAEGGPCNPPGCEEAFCGLQGGQEVAMCHTCQDNYRWTDAVVCSQYFGDVCGDPNNPTDNTAKSLGGCSYNPPPTCGDGTCDTNENCDPTSDHYCPDDCSCTTPTPSVTPCPTDLTSYVHQTGQLQPGYANCNGNAWCLELNLPDDYAHCRYRAEAYVDYPQDCENQEAHRVVSRYISNGGRICFDDFDWGPYCKAQLDIRPFESGAAAANIKTYKIDCGGGGPTPTPTLTPTPFITPTPTPTPPPTATPTPPTECTCAEIFLFDESWGLLWRRGDGELVGGGENLVSPGETIHLVIAGYKVGAGNFDRARLSVDNTNLGESTTQADATVIDTIRQLGGYADSYEGFFTFDYTIPPEGGSFWFTGQIHFVDLNGQGRWLGEMPGPAGGGN